MKTSVTAASAGSGRVSVHGRAWVPRHPAVTLGVVIVLDARHPGVHDLGRRGDRAARGTLAEHIEVVDHHGPAAELDGTALLLGAQNLVDGRARGAGHLPH